MDDSSRLVYLLPVGLVVGGFLYLTSNSNHAPAPPPMSPPATASTQPPPPAADGQLAPSHGWVRLPAAVHAARSRPTASQPAAGSMAARSAPPRIERLPRIQAPNEGIARDDSPRRDQARLDQAELARWEQARRDRMDRPTGVAAPVAAPIETPFDHRAAAPRRERSRLVELPIPAPAKRRVDTRGALDQASQIIEQGNRLAERRAYYSARLEFRRALSVLAQSLDAADGGSRNASLDNAFLSLEEARDFHLASMQATTPAIDNIIVTHETPVLKQQRRNVSLRGAMQIYFTFAQEQLVYAVQDLPPAAEGLFALGKLYKAMAEDELNPSDLNGPRAMAFHQAALLVDPQHFLAANELGVLLASYGQWDDAKRILLQSVTIRPTAEAWHNLAEVHRHLGENDLSQRARWEWRLATERRRQPMSGGASSERDRNSVVRWVDQETFARARSHSIDPPTAAAPVRPPPAAEPSGPRAQPVSTRREAPSSAPSPWWTPY